VKVNIKDTEEAAFRWRWWIFTVGAVVVVGLLFVTGFLTGEQVQGLFDRAATMVEKVLDR